MEERKYKNRTIEALVHTGDSNSHPSGKKVVNLATTKPADY